MEEALIALLFADSGLAALVAARIYPGGRPQGSALPAVVTHRIGGAPLYADDGEVVLGIPNSLNGHHCLASRNIGIHEEQTGDIWVYASSHAEIGPGIYVWVPRAAQTP